MSSPKLEEGGSQAYAKETNRSRINKMGKAPRDGAHGTKLGKGGGSSKHKLLKTHYLQAYANGT
jgi:hypothetical protein